MNNLRVLGFKQQQTSASRVLRFLNQNLVLFGHLVSVVISAPVGNRAPREKGA